jgi:hypothetical protein
MKILAQAPTLALIAVLAACSPTPQPIVTPDAPRPAVSSDTESTPSETPSAVDPEPSAGAIGISTDAVTVLDAGGSTLSYYVFTSDADAAIAGLTEYFDSDPSIGAIEQGTHNWPAVTYTWPGFVLTDWNRNSWSHHRWLFSDRNRDNGRNANDRHLGRRDDSLVRNRPRCG